MNFGLLGRKIGMSQFFDDFGNSIPITIMECGPCSVLKQEISFDGKYSSLLLGYMDHIKNLNKAKKGFFDKIKIEPKKYLKEFRISKDKVFNVGVLLKVDLFEIGAYVNVTSVSKGKGFQGSIKRHSFHRGPMSHGSRYHRRSGSMGACADPSKVFKGKKLPGRMGGKFVTISNLKIVNIDLNDNLLIVKGSVPGMNGQIISVSKV